VSRTNWKTVAACAAAVTAVGCGGTVMAAPMVGLFAAAGTVAAVTDTAAQPCGDRQGTVTVAMTGTHVDGYTDQQMGHAATIVRAGQEMNVPPRGLVIAVATALQESGLRNHGDLGAANDHDSLGLFQQRPSMGWGTPDQVRDPRYAATAFYQRLLKVPNWQNLPLTVAAQAVQRSAYANAYADDEPAASRIVNALTNGAAKASTVAGTCAAPGQVTASGWTVPVQGIVVSGFRTAERPNHNGVDLAAPKRTAIRAAAAGTVVKALCQPETAAVRSCDLDGSPSVPGCGWYVDIQHAGGIITRYCHMIVKPMVTAGQTVTAGQQIGLSGTSGNSSGPHLHFEVHRNGDGSAAGAVDPTGFMRDHGAALGTTT
jgi:murein DD-endopeptidase MepM/ murein hydrolase activator NlpD